jgi:hypothetical protein
MQNGAVHQDECIIPANTLRRLTKLNSRMEGAQEVAQAAMNAFQACRMTLQTALNEACEEEGLALPQGDTPIEIDWRTGKVTVQRPAAPPPPIPIPAERT